MTFKKKPRFFYDEFFRQNFFFFDRWTINEVNNYLIKFYNIEIDSSIEKDGSCFEIQYKDKHIICIWINNIINKPLYYSTIAHECIHAINKVFVYRGFKIELDNDEIQAYYLSLLMKSFLEKRTK